ncbi:MAG: ABC transporter permease [Defluviitaleaceae bacterium]|nr:ABC transporter permease [Defluviitaleaceae bacterium]
MIKGLMRYHFILLVKDPVLVLLGLALPFVQLFLAGSGMDAADGTIHSIEGGMVFFMTIAAMALCWGAVHNHAYSRDIKFLRRLRMSPVKPMHYLVSGILLNIGVLLVFTAALVLVAALVFGISMAGRNWALIIAMLLFAFTLFYVIGMFVANALKKAKNAQSMLYVVFIGMIVGINLLTVDALPGFLHVVIRNIPIIYATNVLQAAWMGTDLFYGHDFIAMMAYILVLGLLSVRFFKYE